MSALTKVPQDWTHPLLPELRDLLVLAYRRPDSAEQIVDEAGIAPGTFPHLHNMRATWTELIRELGNQAILVKLVKKAAVDPTAAAYRDRFLNMLEDHPEVQARQTTGEPDVWWKGDDRAPDVAMRLYPQRLMERRTRLMQIALAQQVTTAARSVARLALRFGNVNAHGTGFFIGARQILTTPCEQYLSSLCYWRNRAHRLSSLTCSNGWRLDYQSRSCGRTRSQNSRVTTPVKRPS